MLSVTLAIGSNGAERNSYGGVCTGGNERLFSDELVRRDNCRISITSETAVTKKVKSMKKPMSSYGNPASFRRTKAPPSMIPSPIAAIRVIAVRNAEIAGVFELVVSLSLKLAPQRLQ